MSSTNQTARLQTGEGSEKPGSLFWSGPHLQIHAYVAGAQRARATAAFLYSRKEQHSRGEDFRSAAYLHNRGREYQDHLVTKLRLLGYWTQSQTRCSAARRRDIQRRWK